MGAREEFRVALQAQLDDMERQQKVRLGLEPPALPRGVVILTLATAAWGVFAAVIVALLL